MSGPIEIREVVQRLADRIEDLAANLLPLGRREGQHWVEARTAKGGLGDSLKVELGGIRRGRFAHYAAGEVGDALDLIAYVRFGGDKKAAWSWALDWLGIERGKPLPAPVRPVVDRRAADQEAAAEKAKKRGRAMAIWREAHEQLRDTPAALYLAGRGLDLTQLGRQPRSLRFHGGLFHAETQQRHPALVALVMRPDGKPISLHRTWLQPDGRGGWIKLQGVEWPKKSYGALAGGFVPLWRGGGPSWTKMAAGTSVIVSEGIEDGLSAAIADPRRRVACGVSLGNIAEIRWPEAVSEIVLLAQHDTHATPLKLRDKAIAAVVRQGIRMLLAFPDPALGKDSNDVLQKEKVS